MDRRARPYDWSDGREHDAGRAPAIGCTGWLRGTGRGFPPRLRRGTVTIDDHGVVWRAERGWQLPVALDVELVELLGQRPLGPVESLWVDRRCHVLVLRYLTLEIEIAVLAEDRDIAVAALR